MSSERMFVKVLDNVIRPIKAAIVLRRYGGIWGLKRHLCSTRASDPALLSVYNLFFKQEGGYIGYGAQLEGTPYFPHGYQGVFISGDARIGKNCVIFHQVTIGSNTLIDTHSSGSPTLGESVYVGAGAKIIGGISIGDHCRIGANAVVHEDMAPHSVAVSAPTRVIQKKELDNRFYYRRDGKWVYYDDGDWVVDATRKCSKDTEGCS